ncbi:hypothetical protein EVJ58_g2151 [Rhodofomes roseus]|uniref:Uncharacterized protein n=1 Tax=Rhodofomes roseus TaxID=34475 RepID=A0A4Y9YTS0_9APHY|nr:hypothetical protein EVJ58_g2151 [Rhodofomes roseus]
MNQESLTLSQEARDLSHAEEVNQQVAQMTMDNARLYRAQARAEAKDVDWSPSQQSSFSRTDSMSSDISADDDDFFDNGSPFSDDLAVVSTPARLGYSKYAQSRRITSPPESTNGDATEADDLSEHEDDDSSQTDTEATHSLASRFPEDKLDARKLRKIVEKILWRPNTENPHTQLEEIGEKHKLDRVDRLKLKQFVEDYGEQALEWDDEELVDVAQRDWPLLLENRY